MTGAARGTGRVAAAVTALAVLAMPIAALSTSGAVSTDGLWTALRLAALEGISLIFLSVLAGALRPVLNRLYKPRTVQRLHRLTGLTGLCLVIGHAVMLLFFGLAGYSRTFLWLGLGALAVMVLATAAAVSRRRLARSWVWLHRLNYLVFFAALVHGLKLGYDVQSVLWLRVWLLACGVAAALGWTFALVRWVRRDHIRRGASRSAL